MGFITTILSFVRNIRNGANVTDVTVNPGGGANVTCENVTPAGDDSNPLLTDYAVILPVQRTGGSVVIGYLDPINTQKSLPGDKRIFARDSTSGADVVELWLDSGGTATISNANGSVVLMPDGSFITTSPVGTLQNTAAGLIKGDNGLGFFQLLPNGDFNVNGFVISPTGDAVGPGSFSATSMSATSVMAAGKELAGHDHPVTTAPGTTGPNN